MFKKPTAMLPFLIMSATERPSQKLVKRFASMFPKDKTHGSRATNSYTPAEWKQQNKKQGRNELCACGSQLKYKKCCGQ